MRMKYGLVWVGAMGLATVGFGQVGETKKWTNKTEVSVVSTNGNTHTTNTSAKNAFGYNWKKATLELIAGGLGARDRGGVTAEQYNASEKVDWKFTEKNYVFEKFGWEKNRFAGIRNRFDAHTGLGRLLLDLPKDKLTAELGGGHVWEERTTATHDTFASGRAYAKYVHKMSDTADFSQDVEYLHNFEDIKGYRLNTETAVIAGLTKHLQLKASYVWKKVNKPAAGFGKHDTTTSMALIVNY